MEVTLDEFYALVAGIERRRTMPWWRQKLDDFVVWAGSKSNYQSGKVVNEYVGGVAYTAPTHEYVALLTVTPDDTSTGSTITETDYTSYTRTEVGTGNNQTDAWNAGTGTTSVTVTNKNAITFPAATGASTNPLIAIALIDASTFGNIVVWATIASTPIASGDTPKINAGAFSINED